ncbi:glycoside hydrolase family 5 protein [Gluconacetobacter sacchari]|uniref:glycoside hydrolase family 5 protein n=1 Tax=Gluconacetobacter sacchari TaxID=92759 RepID=UPI0039B535D6
MLARVGGHVRQAGDDDLVEGQTVRVSRRTILAGGMVVAGSGLPNPRRSIARATKRVRKSFVCGLNCSGLEDSPPGAPTLVMLRYYARRGIRYIRLPGRWEHFQPALGGGFDAQYCNLYRSVLEYCKVAGIRVICEPCHNFGRYKEKGQTYRFGDGRLTPAAFAQFWSEFCRRFGDMSCIVGWDLMNEPYDLAGQGGLSWQEAAQAAILAIRDIDGVRPVWVEGYGYSNPATWPAANPTLHLLDDPARNLIFSAHCYLDRDNSGTHYYWDEEARIGDQILGAPLDRDTGIRRIRPFVEWLRTHSLRGNIGECGAGRQDAAGRPGNEGWLAALDATMRFCDEQDMPIYYWGTGTDLGTAYPYGLEPIHGKDAPQWRILRKYL